tara:strand:+ start:1741 stop:2637 length:897 start_codon:yes stop_codon:yes gene_type:complete
LAIWDREKSNESIPEWFFSAVETEYDVNQVEVEECDIVYQRWGNKENPPILLVHGMHAHAHWWDFIAPQMLSEYQVAAINLSGMGDSDYRYDYSGDIYGQELKAVCDACGFDQNVVLVAHSFGGNVAIKAANMYPDRFGSIVLVDSGLRDPKEAVPDRPSMSGRSGKIYPDKVTALSRFRLQPPQPCDNRFILEYIARNSLMAMEGGWVWKFDDDLLDSITDMMITPDYYKNLTLPIGLIYGEHSELFSDLSARYMMSLLSSEVPTSVIPNAQHHLFLDQPLVFVKELKNMLTLLSSN